MKPVQTDPSYWVGALASERSAGTAAAAATGREPQGPTYQWFDDLVPTYNQSGPSCVGQGWSNWLECVLRRYVGHATIPKGMQLNAEALWFRGRQMFWKGNLSGGLYLKQGFDAMLDLGWLPPDTMYCEIGYGFSDSWEALLDAPLVTAHAVTEGWFQESPQNGCIMEDYRLARIPNAGHCTMRAACLQKAGRNFYAQLNSWGEERGWNGIFVMSEELDQMTSIAPPATAVLPGGFQKLRTWNGWKSALIATPYDGQGIRI